jgi:hypothetical protein
MRYLNISECEGEGWSKPSTAGKRWRSAHGWVYRVFAKALSPHIQFSFIQYTNFAFKAVGFNNMTVCNPFFDAQTF